ncbi:hypothetical protein P5G50_09820 [Leifsonia sp. F6_8S_P_1B]|jgi:hypothetical protein|uniref:Uncharacterized protein n=1 Tax=Leifsonia williamsii TaxID=3035919 RepID=A0ABT8KBB6_9MICO|nr:hypothetical protein [Leifsonia williamsii]MDN4614751.1 hypothetical protein [Leifsonia williamsii]
MSDTGRDEDLDDFREAQETDYEPEPVVHDPDDVPVDDEEEAEDRLLPDDERPVPLDPDDAEIA